MLDHAHYRRGPHDELIEHAPSRCPEGHRIDQPDTVLVGTIPCMCAGPQIGVRSHRSWRCRTCDREWIWPPCAERPSLPTWDGHTPAPRGSRSR